MGSDFSRVRRASEDRDVNELWKLVQRVCGCMTHAECYDYEDYCGLQGWIDGGFSGPTCDPTNLSEVK